MADPEEKQPSDDVSNGNEDDKPSVSLKESMANIFEDEDFQKSLKPTIARMVSLIVHEAVAKEMETFDIKTLVDSNTSLVETLKTRPGSTEDVKEQLSSTTTKDVSDYFLEHAQVPSFEDDCGEKDFENTWHNLADKEIDEAREQGFGNKHGTHAVLCIDTSGSMNEGDAWLHVKQFYKGFLDGMDQLKEQDAHHDNIALVTFGHETKVQQRLTKDLASLRGKLDGINPKGPSPLFGGLVMAAAAANTSKFSFAMVNYLHVTPKIILVTDGRPTELSRLDEDDVADPTKLQQTKKTIFDEVEKLRKTQIDLHCIYVGHNADRKFLRQLQSETVQELMSYRDGEKMALYTVLKCAREGDQRFVRYAGDENSRKPSIPDVPPRTLLQPTRFTQDENIPSKTLSAADHLAALVRLLPMDPPTNQNMTSMNQRSREDTGFSSDEDMPSQSGCRTSTITLSGDHLVNMYKEINDGKHPPIGTRVKRGDNWCWGSQDNHKAGTIIGHATDPSDDGQCWVQVEWDDDSRMKGKQNVYRFKMDDTMEGDVTKTEEDRTPPEGKVLAVGCRVKPGKGFCGVTNDNQGVVIRFYKHLAEIKWDDGSRDRYRFGTPESEIVPVMDPERTAKPSNNKEKRSALKRGLPKVKLTEKMLSQIAATIGKDYQLLGPMLGIHNAKVFHIADDHKDSAVMKILSLLMYWDRNADNPTLDVLVQAIKTSGADYNSDRLQEIIEEIRGESLVEEQELNE